MGWVKVYHYLKIPSQPDPGCYNDGTEMMKVLLGCFKSNLKGIDYDWTLGLEKLRCDFSNIY
jgi:hypothetical protein